MEIGWRHAALENGSANKRKSGVRESQLHQNSLQAVPARDSETVLNLACQVH